MTKAQLKKTNVRGSWDCSAASFVAIATFAVMVAVELVSTL